MPTLREYYFNNKKNLKDKNREIDIRVLLSYVNNLKDMSEFYLKIDEEVKNVELADELLKRYFNGEPIQYLTHEGYLCGDTFYVDSNVLIPRMETEEVIDYASKIIREIFGEKEIVLADVCTGSGCIGIELAKKNKIKKLILSDISEPAIKIAKKNVDNLIPNQACELYVGDALEPIENQLKTIDVIVSNPPYILSLKEVDQNVLDYEPHDALFTNVDLDVYSSILETVAKMENSIKLIVFEIGEEIKSLLENKIGEILPRAQYKFIKDINGKFRVCGIIL